MRYIKLVKDDDNNIENKMCIDDDGCVSNSVCYEG